MKRLLQSALVQPLAGALRTLGRRGALAVVAIFGVAAVAWPRDARVDFNAEVRPVLNSRCISCHGGVKQMGGFSVLFREEALAKTESGRYAIVPGDADASEMMRRISHGDPEERMPREGPPLSEKEIETIRRWIEQGAQWEDHWAYLKPKERPFPEVSDEAWPKGGIDYFILARHDAEELQPSPRADCATLARRVSLDLVGLPPTSEEADRFCRDTSPAAYEKLVDRLLASPRFGEHWAGMWLDLARYADTKGYEADQHRDMWRYRDWVVDALNRDLSFDRFTIEQIAGDLIPTATDRQILATAFHRNTMTNAEGGTSDEEFRVSAVIDRVNTTFEVWQGTTMGCVQCHSHPYDPFRHEDYYRLIAFFDNTVDKDRPDETPRLPAYGKEQEARLRTLLARLDALGDGSKPRRTSSLYEHVETAIYPSGRRPAYTHQVAKGVADDLAMVRPDYDGAYVGYRGVDLTGVSAVSIGYRLGMEGTAVELRLNAPTGPLLVRAPVPPPARGVKNAVTTVRIPATAGKRDVYFVLRTPKGGGFEIDWFSLHSTPAGVSSAAAREAEALRREIAAIVPEGDTPVLQELPDPIRRTTRIYERGNWLVLGDTVRPDVPGSLPRLPRGAPRDRLGLARWMVSPENPLTARVAVNRFWAQIFGTGIVETLEDFGTMGAAPSHPELLDWLALRFMNEHRWSVKSLLKEIVLSASYQQSSRVTPELLERDPYNRLLARGSRVRLSAEQVRDQALFVSGLLSDSMHGPSVFPPQPPNLWNSPFNDASWEISKGEDRYRRGVYTYWKRTVPFPSMAAFDSPTREVCVSRRIRTNTPLQALVTLNDPAYVEAAQALARRMAAAAKQPVERLRSGYRMALFRDPPPGTLATLRSLYDGAIAHYRADPVRMRSALAPYMPYDTASASDDLLDNRTIERFGPMKAGPYVPPPPPHPAFTKPMPADSAEVAALTTVAGIILNMDSFLTRE